MRSIYFLVGITFIITFPLNASPVYLPLKSSETNLYTQIKKCVSHKREKQDFIFRPITKESDYYNVSELMIESAKKSSSERLISIHCLNTLQISKADKELLSDALDTGLEIQKEFLEIYRRWLYSFGQNHKISPLDEKEINKFFEAKHDLYMLLHNQTRLWLFKNIEPKDEDKIIKDFYHLYMSLAKLHQEFYSSVTDDYRNALLDKLK